MSESVARYIASTRRVCNHRKAVSSMHGCTPSAGASPSTDDGQQVFSRRLACTRSFHAFGFSPRAFALLVAPITSTMRTRLASHTAVVLLTLIGSAALPLATANADTAAQNRWVEIGKTRTGNPVFVDEKTVKTGKDGIISATIRVAYLEPVKTPKGNVTASRALAMFDCKASTFATKENAMYIDEKTNNVFQRTVNAQPGFGPAIAGNFADVALKHFCAK